MTFVSSQQSEVHGQRRARRWRGKLSKTRRWWPVAAVGLLLLAGFAIPAPARAGLDDVIYEILGWITGLFVQFLGAILVKIIDLIVRVAQYNDFGNALVVQTGWIVVRDVANMFFIMVLLVIAFGTVLKWETYRYNRLLGRLILMAILINFSKFIALFFIDISQVIMLTFVHAFQDAAVGNLTTGFGVRAMVEFAQQGVGDIKLAEVVIAMVLAVIMLLIAVIVSLIILLMLIQRIIAFWLLVVLSPAAYLAAALPAGGLRRFNSTWWQQFGKYWTTGPLLAFFFWLALSVIQNVSVGPGGNVAETATIIPLNTAGESFANGVVNVVNAPGQELPAAASRISTTQNIFNYIVTIGILMAAIVAAQQLGGMAGGFAGQALGKIRQAGTKAVRAGLLPARLAREGALALGRKADEKVIQPLSRYPLRAAAAAFKTVAPEARWTKGLEVAAKKGVSARPTIWREAFKAYRGQREREKYEEPRGAIQDFFQTFISRQQTDYARQARRRRYREEEAKVDTEESSEAQKIYRDAQKTKNVQQMAGSARRLARQGNLDDLVRNLGYTTESEGFYKFIDEELIKKGGMKPQEADELGNDLAYVAESNRQWGLARMYKYNQQVGRWERHRTPEDWAKAVAAQQTKRDPQQVVRENHRTTYVREGAAGVTAEGEYVDPNDPRAVDWKTIDTGRLNATGEEILGTLTARHADRMQPNAMAELFLNHAEEWLGSHPEFYARVFASMASLPDESKLRWRGITPRILTKDPLTGKYVEENRPIPKPAFVSFTSEDQGKLKAYLKKELEERTGKEVNLDKAEDLRKAYEDFPEAEFEKNFRLNEAQTKEAAAKFKLTAPAEAQKGERTAGGKVTLTAEQAETILQNPQAATPQQLESLGEMLTHPDMAAQESDIQGVRRRAEATRQYVAPEEMEFMMREVTGNLEKFQDALARVTRDLGQDRYADQMIKSVIEPLKHKITEAQTTGTYKTREDQERLLDQMRRVYEVLNRQYEEAKKRGGAGVESFEV